MSGKNLVKRKREEPIIQNNGAATSQKQPKLTRNADGQQEAPLVEDAVAAANASSTRRQILLEAIKRIIELQNELDDFENDLDANTEYQTDAWQRQQQQQSLHEEEEDEEEVEEEAEETTTQRRSEAEALGFAMCARETLTFLQREGISSNSLIYRTLKEKLTGQTDGVIPI